MASPWFCDLSDATFVDRTGDDVANELTGPAGFQAAIRGTGNATALAAGDTIYLSGTGDLSRLIEIDCNGTDISNWDIGDTVQNDNLGGGAAGDDWTGVVVEPAVGAVTDIVLIWLDANKDEADVDLADGIENTVAGGGAGDPTNVGALASVETPGIEWDGNGGSRAGGQIKTIGTTDLTDPTNNFGEAILDGRDHALTKRANFGINFTVAIDLLFSRFIAVQQTAGDGWRQTSGGSGEYLFWKCSSNNNDGNGWDGNATGMRESSFVQCQANGNAGKGFDRSDFNTRYVFCEAKDNTQEGIEDIDAGVVCIGCIGHNNSIGFELFGSSAFIMHCVADGNSSRGIDFTSATVNNFLAISNRITNQSGTGDIGIDSGSADNFVWENWNAFFNNDTDRQNVDAGEDSSSAGADDGYTNQAGDDFNVLDDKTLDSVAVTVP